MGEQARQRTGLSRRDLIKRSAIVGGAAWTAPVIVESLLSPAGAVTLCVCDTAADYTGAKVENLSGCGGIVQGALGFTGNANSENRCGARCWVQVNGIPNVLTGSAASFNCGTFTVNLPAGCNFGAKGMVAVFGGGDCTGNFFVEGPAPYDCPLIGDGGENFYGAMAASDTTFTLPINVRQTLSHVNVTYCCC